MVDGTRTLNDLFKLREYHEMKIVEIDVEIAFKFEKERDIIIKRTLSEG